MFDMSWGEVLVIGTVALIVIGPKDLPKALRTVGNTVGKVRRMAGEFQAQFNDAMREAELDEMRREVERANQQVASFSQTRFDPVQTARDELKGAIESPLPATTPAAGEVPAPASPSGAASPAHPVAPPAAAPETKPGSAAA